MPRNGTPRPPRRWPRRPARCAQGLGAPSEGAHAGQHHAGGLRPRRRDRRPAGRRRRRAGGPSRPSAGCRCRSRGRRSRGGAALTARPWSTGRPRPRSAPHRATHRATALNDASTMWWVLRPVTRRTCRVMPAAVDEGPPELLGQLGVEGRRAQPGGVRRRSRSRRPGTAGPTGRGPRRPAPRRAAARSRRSAGRPPCRRAPRPTPRRARCRRPRRCGGRRRRGRRSAATVRSNPPCRPSWLEHVVEERQAGGDLGGPGAVEVDRDLDRVSLVARDPTAVGGAASVRLVGARTGAAVLIAGFRSGRPGTGRSPRGAPPSPAGTR